MSDLSFLYEDEEKGTVTRRRREAPREAQPHQEGEEMLDETSSPTQIVQSALIGLFARLHDAAFEDQ